MRGAGPVDETTRTNRPGSTSLPATSVGSSGTDHEMTVPGRHHLVVLLDQLDDEVELGQLGRDVGVRPTGQLRELAERRTVADDDAGTARPR